MTYTNITTDKERAFFGISNASVSNCRFEGPEDGESAFKETHDLTIDSCYFDLRYPIWHTKNTTLSNSEMTEKCRAALWYDEDVKVTDCILHGPKVFRDCKNVVVENCDIVSDEFAWSCDNITIINSKIESVYPFLMSKNVKLINCKIKAKYMCQYTKNCTLDNCEIETKDAFWECENAKMTNCRINSEYVAWHSYNSEFVNCSISGTQPFCYCDNLVLRKCTMSGCDFSFEKSSVDVEIIGKIDSVRGPVSGIIKADEIGEILPSSDGNSEIEAEIIVK